MRVKEEVYSNIASHSCSAFKRNLPKSTGCFLTSKKATSLFAFAILVVHFLYAQVCFSQHSTYQYYEINKIHSNEVIKGISKDKKGLVWLATDNGVLQFDGNTTNLFYKELQSPFTKKFLERRNGQFLVLTDFGIKEVIQNEDTTYFRPMQVAGKPLDLKLTYPKSLFEDKHGNLWIGEINALVKITDKGYKRYFLGADYQSISYHRTFSFTEDAFGHLWIAPFNGRLLAYDRKEDKFKDVPIEYPVSDVSCIVTLKGDHLIIGGKEGLLQIKVDSDKNILQNNFIKGPENISTAFVSGEEIYVGTWDSGIYHGNIKKKPYEFTHMSAIPFNDILDIYHDKQQQEIWLTGSENIGLLKPSFIKSVGKTDKFRVESFTRDSIGNLFISTGSEILKRSHGGTASYRKILSSKSTYFDRILFDEHKLWIGDSFGAISYYDLIEDREYKMWDSTAQPITYIFKDDKGNKWFSGLTEGLIRINSSNEVKIYNDVKNSVVIKASPEGKLFCSGHGKDLYEYDAERDQFSLLDIQYDFEASPSIQTEDIAFDSLGVPHLATTEGLVKLLKKDQDYRAVRVKIKGVDVNEPIKAIVSTTNGIWLAYSHALAVYHKGQVIFYTRENGLPSRLLKERGFSLYKDKLSIATAKGLAQIDLKALNYNATAQPMFKNVLVNGNKYPISNDKEIVFPYGARIQVEFVSLSYPGDILYQTKVKGLEENWSEPSANHSISVLGFSEGSYTLSVRARNNGYLWSKPLQLPFTISSPWFKSWWAIMLFILTTILLILASVKIYHYHLIRQKRKLKNTIDERTKEINRHKNEIILQKNKIIQQKEELIERNNAVFKSRQALSEADLNYLHLKEKQLHNQIEYRNKQITTHTLNIIQKNEMLKTLSDQLEKIIKSPKASSPNELRKMLKIIDESFRLDKDWDEFKLYFEQIYTGFYAKLKINYPMLTNQELRHCALIRLNLSNNECASILGISPGSVKVSRTRLRKKLDLENHHSLTDFVMSI